MPLTNREAIQLGLLLLCVPLQYFLSNHFSTTVTERSQIGHKLTTEIQTLREYLHLDVGLHEGWRKLIGYLVATYASFVQSRRLTTRNTAPGGAGEAPPESPAVEVHQYRQRNYGSDQSTRSHRPPYLRFRVGQVVTHKVDGYKAVIIGWDLRAKMGDPTFPGVIFDTQSQVVQTTPHYTLLVDQRDAAALAKSGSPTRQTYVVQTQLELTKNTKVQHPELKDYFLYFDGGQYIPKDILRKIYPKD